MIASNNIGVLFVVFIGRIAIIHVVIKNIDGNVEHDDDQNK